MKTEPLYTLRKLITVGAVIVSIGRIGVDFTYAAPPEPGEFAAATTVLCDERGQIELLARAFRTKGMFSAKSLYQRLHDEPNDRGEPTCNYQRTQGLVSESAYLGEGLDNKLALCKVWAVRLTPPGNVGWIGWYECAAGRGA